MARRVTVLRTEGRAKGVDGTQGSSAELTLELTAHGEVGLTSEEVFVVLHLTALGHTVKVKSSHLKHRTGTLSIAGCDQRRVEVVKAMVMEILMDGDGHVMANAEDSTKSIGAQTQVSVLTHILEALSLLLHRIVAWATTVELQFGSLDLAGLSFALALDELTGSTDARTGSDALEQFLIHR